MPSLEIPSSKLLSTQGWSSQSQVLRLNRTLFVVGGRDASYAILRTVEKLRPTYESSWMLSNTDLSATYGLEVPEARIGAGDRLSIAVDCVRMRNVVVVADVVDCLYWSHD
eukprot:3939398-Rhodomonas_salina.1